MADLELEAPEAVVLDGSRAFRDQVVPGDREPPYVGVVGLELFLGGAAKQLPERQSSGLGAQIPKRDVDRRERKVGDAGAADPADGGEVGELAPEPVAFRGVLADQQRRVALRDAEAISLSVGRCACVPVNPKPLSPSSVLILAPTTPQWVTVWVESEIDPLLIGTCRINGSTDRIFKATGLRFRARIAALRAPPERSNGPTNRLFTDRP